jgi:type IX secretion system PorP/SprF family membrane protein
MKEKLTQQLSSIAYLVWRIATEQSAENQQVVGSGNSQLFKVSYLRAAILVVLFCIFTEGGILHAQQEGNMTLFMYNPVLFNPAAAGASEAGSITVHHRSQWIGFKGAPRQQFITYSGKPFSNRSGIGLSFVNRRVGIFETQTGIVSYSYSLVDGKEWKIRLGLQGSLRRYGFRFNDIEEGVDFYKDNSIARDFKTVWTGNVGMGIHISYEDAFFSAGMPFLVTNLLGINELSPSTATEARHYYAMGGLSLPVTEGVKLKPSMLVKFAQNTPWNLETNMNLSVKESVILGVSYRVGKTNMEQLGESVGFITVVQITDRISIGASYDWILSGIKQYSSGSAEFVLRYNLTDREVQLSNPRGSGY